MLKTFLMSNCVRVGFFIFISPTELSYFAFAGSFEWGCHFHWQSWSKCSSVGARHFDNPVS